MTKRLTESPESFLPLTPVAFEILLALAEGGRHGYEVMIEIERRSAGRISPNPGTLYRALDRLVQEGLLASAIRSVDGENRRVFSLSPLGKDVAAAEAARCRIRSWPPAASLVDAKRRLSRRRCQSTA